MDVFVRVSLPPLAGPYRAFLVTQDPHCLHGAGAFGLRRLPLYHPTPLSIYPRVPPVPSSQAMWSGGGFWRRL